MPLNPNPIPHRQPAPDGGYWIKLAPGQTGATFPLTLLYDAPPSKRPVFDSQRVVEFCMQTYDNSKAFIIVWAGQTAVTTWPDSMTPVAYDVLPVLMNGRTVTTTAA